MSTLLKVNQYILLSAIKHYNCVAAYQMIINKIINKNELPIVWEYSKKHLIHL